MVTILALIIIILSLVIIILGKGWHRAYAEPNR